VRLVTDRGVAVAPAARDPDLAKSVLATLDAGVDVGACAAAFPGTGQMRAEIAAVKKEAARLRAKRDILKKAAAFFAREAT
jgi:transposase